MKKNMNKKIAAVILAMTTATTSFSTVNVASAHDVYVKHHHKIVKQAHKHRKHHQKAKNNAVVWGIVGLAAGAIIANSVSKNKTTYSTTPPTTNHPGAHHFPAAPQPATTYSSRRTYEPWTPAWKRYCSSRFKTFNPQTGTYRGYDGQDHFCVYR